MRIYVQCPNCKMFNKLYSEAAEVLEDRITCKNCGRIYYLQPVGDCYKLIAIDLRESYKD